MEKNVGNSHAGLPRRRSVACSESEKMRGCDTAPANIFDIPKIPEVSSFLPHDVKFQRFLHPAVESRLRRISRLKFGGEIQFLNDEAITVVGVGNDWFIPYEWEMIMWHDSNDSIDVSSLFSPNVVIFASGRSSRHHTSRFQRPAKSFARKSNNNTKTRPKDHQVNYTRHNGPLHLTGG